MSLILDGTTGVPVTTVTGTLPVANGGTGSTTGTASININGTVGATTPAAGAFTTLSASGGIVSTLASLGANTGKVVLLKSDGTLTTDGTQLNWDSANDALTINSGIVISSSQLRTSGSAALTLSNADGSAYVLLNPGGGNVGIGTASPGALLEISRSGSGADNLYLRDTGAGTPGIRFYSTGAPSAPWALYAYDNANFCVGIIGVHETLQVTRSGNVGIGTASPSYQLHVNTDSAGKPGAGGLWTVVSDERIKANIVPADLDRCYEIVKSVPLKHFGFAPGVYTDDQIHDKHNLGWIAQDVQKVFKHAVSVKPFTLKTAIPDGTEDYEEQDFTLETVEDTKVSIEILNGKPVQVSKTVSTENKVLLFDTVDVLDEAGVAVMDGDNPLTHQMPRMVTKTRPKVRHEVIEDCLDLNSGQMIAALYGAVQALMAKVDTLEAKLAAR